MSYVVRGRASATKVSSKPTWDRIRGYSLQEIYEGSRDAIYGLQADVVASGNASSIEIDDSDKPLYRAIIRWDPGVAELPESPTTEQELSVNTVNVDLFEHPFFREISTIEKDEIRKAVNENRTLNTSVVSTPPGFSSDGLTLYTLLKKGVTSYPVWQPVLTITDTAPYGYAFNVDYGNVGVILSEQIVAGISNAAGNLSASLPFYQSSVGDLVPGWMKLPPQIRTVAGGRRSVTYTFEYGLWSTALYDYVF